MQSSIKPESEAMPVQPPGTVCCFRSNQIKFIWKHRIWQKNRWKTRS